MKLSTEGNATFAEDKWKSFTFSCDSGYGKQRHPVIRQRRRRNERNTLPSLIVKSPTREVLCGTY